MAIQATERTSDALKELRHQLFSVEKASRKLIRHWLFRSLQAQFPSPASFPDGILSNQDTRARFQNTFEEWTNYSTNEYLHESDSGGVDVFREVELRLLGERLHIVGFYHIHGNGKLCVICEVRVLNIGQIV